MADEAEQATGPIATATLIGHGGAEQAFLDTAAAGRMPHAWLLSGPRGIGKMTLALRMARFQLSQTEGGLFGVPDDLQMSPDEDVFRRVLAGGHGDLQLIERTFNDKTKKMRGDIVVDQIRALGRFFAMTSAEGGWRIAIIDGAEEMNPNAANALLKLLEEPPENSLLLLVSHAAGRLLPTIRSRCRQLVLRPLSEDDAMAVLAEQLPDLAEAERLGLVRLAEGSPGRAIAMAAEGGLQTYDELLAMVRNLPELDFAAVHALGDRLNRANNEAAYRVWIDLLRLWLSRLARGGAALERMNEAVAGETALAQRLTGAVGLDRWVELWEKIGGLAMRAERVNLDRKQVVLNAFMALQNTARQ
ncbi:MAG: DNA polymerase III subunit delta' [Alphaproteobacteria bacterium]|jgi:DNA polymerase-3 subunit delta'|nr:DNA polymerase III subunit delta' [Alphaproteobacteria bacterium]MDP6830622.1 DNA polymerase III subunit delta' [Alphaproteobacteria bacterium]MDP6872324.1 DNA polymerase III subunit delta' [Alphaproteobacteria bacterium]